MQSGRPLDHVQSAITLVKDVTENMDKYELGIALSRESMILSGMNSATGILRLAKYRIYHAEENSQSAN